MTLPFRPSSENILHQKHVKHRAPCHGKKHLTLPQMKDGGESHAQGLRNAVAACEDGHILQTVHHQQSKDRGWQRLSQVFHIGRKTASRLENEERQETGGHGAQNAESNSGNLLPQRHGRHKNPPAFSMGFLKTVSTRSIPAMAGMIKESFPKKQREAAETKSPMRAV